MQTPGYGLNRGFGGISACKLGIYRAEDGKYVSQFDLFHSSKSLSLNNRQLVSRLLVEPYTGRVSGREFKLTNVKPWGDGLCGGHKCHSLSDYSFWCYR